MSAADQAIEAEIVAKGLTAPRVTPADIEAAIASEHYFTAMDGALSHGSKVDVTGALPERLRNDAGNFAVPFPNALSHLTFCVLVLRNGFTVTGESACTSPKNFDAELGRKIARENAINKVWPLMGYALKELMNNFVTAQTTYDQFLAHTGITHSAELFQAFQSGIIFKWDQMRVKRADAQRERPAAEVTP